MYKVDIQNKSLTKLNNATFSKLGLKERYDIQEWIEKTPSILGEELLVIAKEHSLPSGTRLDLLAIDKQANLVIIELKRDDSGSEVEWQSIKYASYCSNYTHEEIYRIYAEYLSSNEDESELKIETFINEDLEKLNESQRIVLVSKEFHSDVASAVLWLRDFGLNIQCVKLEPFIDLDNNLFINPNIIIPLPEAKDYIKRKENKTQKKILSKSSSFSLEKSNFKPEKLKTELLLSLNLPSELIPRVQTFLRILLSENKNFDREEIKTRLHKKGIGNTVGHAGRHLSNISSFLTNKSNPHFRQIVTFSGGSIVGEQKNNYEIIEEYRTLVTEVLDEIENARAE